MVAALLALTILFITHNGHFTRYVKPGLEPYLYVSGVLVLAAGIATMASRRRSHDHTGHPGHHHHHHGEGGPRIGWLLLLPVLAILLVAPPALGSFGVDFSSARTDPLGNTTLRPLPSGNPVNLPLTDYSARAADGKTLQGRQIRLTGFVTPGPRGTWYVTRFIIICCAADARPVGALVSNARAPQANTWVAVTGSWRPSRTGTPVLAANRVRPTHEPSDPYLYNGQ
jgi:uncharacterized repeat protein (TIGR03943 family)